MTAAVNKGLLAMQGVMMFHLTSVGEAGRNHLWPFVSFALQCLGDMQHAVCIEQP